MRRPVRGRGLVPIWGLCGGDVLCHFFSSFVRERLEMGVYPGSGPTADPALRIATISYSLYRSKGSAVGWDGSVFSGLSESIGAVLGYSVVGELKKMGVDVYEVGSAEQGFRMLAKEHLSGLVLQTITGNQMLKSPEYSGFERVDPPIVSKDYYVMLSANFVKADPALAQKVWSTIASLREPMTSRVAEKYAN